VILSIDQGTSGTTCLVVDGSLEVRGRGYAELTQHFPQPGWVEHDPEEIWQTVLQAAVVALDTARIGAGDLRAIGVTNQRETTVLWDRRTGRPVHNAIVWQDGRTADACRALPGAMLRERTGLMPSPYFSATKLRWLLDHVGEDPAALAFGTVDSWLIWRLTGGRAHLTDRTNASRTLLCGLGSLDWDDELLRLFGVPHEVLPTIVPSTGVVAEASLLGATVPDAGIAGDQQAALAGQACFAPGDAKVTYGTGSFLLVHDGDRPEPPPEGLLRSAAAPAGYALEGSVFVAGAAIQWLGDGLGLLGNAAEAESLARSVDGNDGVYFVPALAGLGAPHWDPHARGLICGLDRGSGRAHLVRAALESIAYQVCDVVDAVPGGVGRLRADGGAAANGFLMQFQADMLGQPVEVGSGVEMTALGAAALAGIGAGVFTGTDEVAAAWRPSAAYEPAMSEDERATLLDGWRTALGRTLTPSG
jgi:glycerol kinase